MSLLEAARNNNVREIYRILTNQGRAISAREKIQAISEAIKNNHQPALIYLWQECIPSIPKKFYHNIAFEMLHAANHNHNFLLAVMITDRHFMTNILHSDKAQWFEILAKNERSDLFRRFIEIVPMTSHHYGSTCYRAAGKGENQIVRILLENKGNMISDEDKSFALIHAGQNGHFNIVKYIAESHLISKSQFNYAVRDICTYQRSTPARMQIIRYLLTTHKNKILSSYIEEIYTNANAEVREYISKNFKKSEYNPSLIKRAFKTSDKIERDLIENGHIKLWRNAMWSIVNMTISTAIGLLFGLTAPMLLLATAGTFAFSMTILWIRNSIKSSCMESYRNKNAAELAELSPEMKLAFHEGCDAAQNYLHHTNACLPTSNAFWHPKAFYAGFEVMTLRQDYANVGREQELRETEQLIRKIVPR